MFKKSDNHKQLDAFSSPIEYLKDSSMNYWTEIKKLYICVRKQM